MYDEIKALLPQLQLLSKAILISLVFVSCSQKEKTVEMTEQTVQKYDIFLQKKLKQITADETVQFSFMRTS
jgi:hypothetical protein